MGCQAEAIGMDRVEARKLVNNLMKLTSVEGTSPQAYALSNLRSILEGKEVNTRDIELAESAVFKGVINGEEKGYLVLEDGSLHSGSYNEIEEILCKSIECRGQLGLIEQPTIFKSGSAEAEILEEIQCRYAEMGLSLG